MNAPLGLFVDPYEAIPPLPEALSRLLGVAKSASRREILSIMRSDPDLTDSVILLADTPYYGGRRAPISAVQLVDRVGLVGVQQLFLRAALQELLFSHPARHLHRLRDHSTATAYTTLVIARHTPLHSEIAFISALLQHTGAVLPILALLEHGIRDEETQWELIGCAHEAIAGLAAAVWNLPERIRRVLLHHHQRVSPETDPVVAALQLADLITCDLERGLDVSAHPPPDDAHIDAALTRLELPVSRLPQVRREASEALARVG